MMLRAASQPEPARISRRQRKVRIVRRRRYLNAATITLALCTLAALAMPVVWYLLQTDETINPEARTFEEIELRWRCNAGHTFYATGQIGPRQCWHCDRLAYPVTQFVCPVHGAFEVGVRFERDEEGLAVPTHVRLTGREWVPIDVGLFCPVCERPLAYERDDPLQNRMRPGP